MKVLNQIVEIVEANEIAKEELEAIQEFIADIICKEEIVAIRIEESFEVFPYDEFPLTEEHQNYIFESQDI